MYDESKYSRMNYQNEDILKNPALDKDKRAEELRMKILDLVSEYAQISHVSPPFVSGKSKVPTSGRVYDDNELKTLVASSLDFWLTAGRFNAEFEKKLAEFLGVNFVITTNSGSSANLLAMSALTSELLGDKALKPGDEVLGVAASFPTTVNPILQNNLVPVFVDIDIPTYNIDSELIENAISDKTKAIMLAHTLGNPFNLDIVMEIATKYNLWVIEDCCDALGSTYNGKLVGTFGDISTASFYPAHHITMGEGGAVFTNNPNLKRAIESFRDWGRDCFCAPGQNNTCGKRFEWKLGDMPYGYDHKFIYSNLGYNLKLTDMQAAVGLAQLQKLPKFIEKRKNNFRWLMNRLKHLEEYFLFPEATKNSEPAWFGFPIMIKENAPFTLNDINFYLTSHGVDTRPIFAGNIIKQPYFLNKKYRKVGELKNTDIMMNRVFWIGVYPGLTEDMMEYVVKTIEEFINLKNQDKG